MVDVVDRLLAQAARTPDAPAVVARGQTITYAAFVDRAAAFARRVGEVGQPRVMIALDKGTDAYVAMFGTLMAGGVYAPVNVASPPARLMHIRDLFEPDLIVAEAPLAGRLAEGRRTPSPASGRRIRPM